jgi:hypothetical protein
VETHHQCDSLHDKTCDDEYIAGVLQAYAQQIDNYFERMIHHSPPVFRHGYNHDLMALVTRLYPIYQAELRDLKDQLRTVYTASDGFPQYDDIEGELTILFLLHFQPRRIFEFSPSHGWSTLYILNAIQTYQQQQGESKSIVELKSFDLEDYCSDIVHAITQQ